MPHPGKEAHIGVTAYHEAGHIFAALREGHFVEEAHVCMESPGDGWTRHWIPTQGHNLFERPSQISAPMKLEEFRFSQLRSSLRILLAGPLSEAKALNTPLRSLGSRSDLDKCKQLAQAQESVNLPLNRKGQKLPSNWAKPVNRERKWVRRWIARPENWKVIEALAWELASQGHLSHGEIARVVGQALAPEWQRTLNLGGR